MIEEATEKLRGILSRMGVESEVAAREEAERIVLEIKGPDTALLIGKHGATLDSLQYLVQRMMGPGGRLVVVDAEGYRDRRNESLVEMANRLAEKARKTLRPVPASPMSPADRRVMHMALAGMPGLTTRSEGEGAARHLVVVPDPNYRAPSATGAEDA